MPHRPNRRDFLQTASMAALASSTLPMFGSPSLSLAAQAAKSPNERLNWAVVGSGDRWGVNSKERLGAVGGQSMPFGDYVAVCDVDSDRANRAKELTGGKADVYEDYRQVLDRKDVDAVIVVTTDHWHVKVAIEAMKAGKDVYCEKPLTLTIEEGQQICKVAKETGRVFQVGTQQRSEMGNRFLTFVALAHSGRLGKLKKITCAIGGAPSCDPQPIAEVPANLNWNMWLGQAPETPYRKLRCHYEFRWWYEYSGGKMTDWGAHHVDIASWAINMLGESDGPTKITPVMDDVVHPVPLKDGMPTQDDRYNTATKFRINVSYPNDLQMVIRDQANDLGFGNGIMLEGENGTIFVDRGKITGDLVDDLKTNPLPDDAIKTLCKGKEPGNHMRNFVECIRDRSLPVSDVFTHHKAMTTCHLANIAIRLGHELNWDAKAEKIVGDDQAQSFVSREQRKGFEIKV